MLNIDYLKAAARLHGELQAFHEMLQRLPCHHIARQTAQRRLQQVVAQLEPLGEDPGEAWESLSIEQRWGYLRLASFLGTATYELRRREVNA